jgi:hypothetical protein
MLLIRENDQVLELFLPHGAWKWFALPLAIVLLWKCLRQRDTLIAQAQRLSASPPFGVYLAGGTLRAGANLRRNPGMVAVDAP